MRIIHLLPVFLYAVSATATPPGSTPVPVELQPVRPPACSYLQPQVKQCEVSSVGGVGTFTVLVQPPAGLVVTFDEPLTGMQPPPSSSYKATISGNTATVLPTRRDPVSGATVHFDTASVHVTLNLKVGGPPDTQLLITDPRKTAQDDEADRRVKDALAGLEERASQRAEEILLTEIGARGFDTAELEAPPARHGQVVVRATRLLRVGNRRFLLLSISNRAGDDIELKTIRAWSGARNADHEVPRLPFRAASPVASPGEDLQAVIAIPAKALPAGGSLRLKVEFTDPDRNVDLDGIRLR